MTIERKGLGDLFAAIADRIDQLAERLGRTPEPAAAEPDAPEPRSQIDTSGIEADIETLRARYEKRLAEWQEITAEAANLNEVTNTLAAAIDAATSDVERDDDVRILTERLDKYMDQWTELANRAKALREVVDSLDSKIGELEGQLASAERNNTYTSPSPARDEDGDPFPPIKSMEKTMSRTKGVYDPEDTTDRTALQAHIDDLGQSVRDAIRSGDDSQLGYLRETLSNIAENLDDETESRTVQSLIEDIDQATGGKSVGAHLLYR